MKQRRPSTVKDIEINNFYEHFHEFTESNKSKNKQTKNIEEEEERNLLQKTEGVPAACCLSSRTDRRDKGSGSGVVLRGGYSTWKGAEFQGQDRMRGSLGPGKDAPGLARSAG